MPDNGTNGELRELVTALRIAVGKLESVVEGAAARDSEDRIATTKGGERLSALEAWQSRIRGQIALIWFLVGGLITVGLARVFHVLP